MAYAARYIFRCAYDAQEQITRLFDFVGPTAIALWNLKWQVQGFLAQVPDASSEDLSSRFALGSAIRGGEIRRACIDTSWDEQLHQFASVVLINAIASFEDFTLGLAEGVTTDPDAQRRISTNLQFPGGTVKIAGAPNREAGYKHFENASQALAGIFTTDPRVKRRYAGNKIDNLLLCYRFFKSIRNAIAHSGGRVSTEVLNNYARFKPVATPALLGIKEVPIHVEPKLDQAINLNLRGVIGLTNIILRVVATYDIDFGTSTIAEKEVASRLRSALNRPNKGMIAGRSPKRELQIISRIQGANLPVTKLTPAFEVFLKAEKIIPHYF